MSEEVQKKLAPQPGPVQFDCEVVELHDQEGTPTSSVRINIRTITGEFTVFLPPQGVEVMVGMLTEALQYAKTGIVQVQKEGLIIPMNGKGQ